MHPRNMAIPIDGQVDNAGNGNDGGTGVPGFNVEMTGARNTDDDAASALLL